MKQHTIKLNDYRKNVQIYQSTVVDFHDKDFILQTKKLWAGIKIVGVLK